MKASFRITQAEWDVMAVVWDRGPIAAAAIAEELKLRKQWTLATVRTLLRRLVNKGALGQKLDGKRYLYTAGVTMDECVRRESDSFLDRALGRAASISILHLVRKAELSTSDIEELREILREKEKKS